MKKIAILSTMLFVSISIWAQSNLTQAEYFFDTDPGMGAGSAIAGFATSTSIDVNDMIDVSGLSIGMHTLGIRVMDDNVPGVWSMAEYIPVFITLASANIVSNLTAAEYFFDTDPGMGSGNTITLTTAQNIDLNDIFPTAALSLGMHTLNIRIRNEFNEWSMVETIPIFVTKASAILVEDIDQVEYFFDTDPGISLATPLVITAAQNIDINDLIPTGALSTGMHTLNIRIRTTNDEWSLAESVPVFINQDNLITQLEHFVNTDPGIGSATNVAITPPTNTLDEDIIVATGALGFGPHTVNVRLGGATIWGQTESIPFNICSGADANFTVSNTCIGDATNFTDTSTGVIGGDSYFWDFENDGATDDVTNGDVSFTYGSPGSYTAELLIDRGGCEGYRYATVEVVDLPTSTAGSNQTICVGDPAILTGAIGGSATASMWTTSGTGNFDFDTNPIAIYTPDAGDISAGSVVLTLTSSEPFTVCADAVSQTTITIQQPPTANAGTNQTVCSDAVVSLSGTIGGSATTNLWTTSGSGTFVDPTSAITNYTPSTADITAGSLTLTLTASEPLAACSDAVSQTTITINEVPTPLAGADQSICSSDMANLAGAISGDFTAQSWATSGTGTFDNNTLLNALYTPSAADVTSGLVTLSLSATAIAPCTDVVSQLTLSINSTIAVVEQSTDVSIGTPVNVDVFNGATSSGGDVLTTTIIQEPTKGTATILADGTFDYIALENNVGLDVIIFEVCNQCGNCDTNNAVMNILNVPPAIVVPTTTAVAGSVVTIPLIGQLSDINDNIDLSTLEVVVQPGSGALASISMASELIVDYTGVSFSGTDELTLRVCDLLTACGNAVISIEVSEPGSPPVTVFNAVSPNGDGKHDFLEIENIEFYPDNKVTLFNRWGDVVFESQGYNNSDIAFKGLGKSSGELSAGTYYYSVDLNDGTEVLTGFVMLNR